MHYNSMVNFVTLALLFGTPALAFPVGSGYGSDGDLVAREYDQGLDMRGLESFESDLFPRFFDDAYDYALEARTPPSQPGAPLQPQSPTQPEQNSQSAQNDGASHKEHGGKKHGRRRTRKLHPPHHYNDGHTNQHSEGSSGSDSEGAPQRGHRRGTTPPPVADSQDAGGVAHTQGQKVNRRAVTAEQPTALNTQTDGTGSAVDGTATPPQSPQGQQHPHHKHNGDNRHHRGQGRRRRSRHRHDRDGHHNQKHDHHSQSQERHNYSNDNGEGIAKVRRALPDGLSQPVPEGQPGGMPPPPVDEQPGSHGPQHHQQHSNEHPNRDGRQHHDEHDGRHRDQRDGRHSDRHHPNHRHDGSHRSDSHHRQSDNENRDHRHRHDGQHRHQHQHPNGGDRQGEQHNPGHHHHDSQSRSTHPHRNADGTSGSHQGARDSTPYSKTNADNVDSTPQRPSEATKPLTQRSWPMDDWEFEY